MTALLTDPLAESQRLIDALEQHAAELPFADEHLALHRPTRQELERCQHTSDQAVAAWRAALAQRWECEVAGRRLYKQIYRQYVEHYGSAERPEVRRIASGREDSDTSPTELLADLRRLQADLALHNSTPFAARRQEVQHAVESLEAAINEAAQREVQRRASVLDRRMVQEVFRRARTTTQRAISAHFGENLAPELRDLLA